MNRTLLNPVFIVLLGFIFQFKYGPSDEVLLFIIPSMIAQSISHAVLLVGIRMSVEDAKSAFFVANSFEVIAIHQMSLMTLAIITEDYLMINFLVSMIYNCWGIGMMGMVFYQMGVMVISEKKFLVRFVLTCFGIGIVGYTCASVWTVVQSGHVKGLKSHQVNTKM